MVDAHGFGRVPAFVEHDETFDLVVFGHHEVRQVVRGGIWRKETGPPTWKRLDRRAVEVLVGAPV